MTTRNTHFHLSLLSQAYYTVSYGKLGVTNNCGGISVLTPANPREGDQRHSEGRTGLAPAPRRSLQRESQAPTLSALFGRALSGPSLCVASLPPPPPHTK